jgi:Rrf2 family protein
MKLSLRGEYALRALVVLGENYESDVVRIQNISEERDIPKRFLEQILNDLKSGGFVESRRGVAGGYRLARPPQEITLGALIRYVERSLVPLPLAAAKSRHKNARTDEVQAAIRSVMQEVRVAILAVLERVTIADLCERARKLRGEATEEADYVI